MDTREQPHTTIRIAAVLLRVIAVLSAMLALAAAVAVWGMGNAISGALPQGMRFSTAPFAVLVILMSIPGLVIMWALADALTLIADGDNQHRWLAAQIAALAPVSAPQAQDRSPRNTSGRGPHRVAGLRSWSVWRRGRVAGPTPLMAEPALSGARHGTLLPSDDFEVEGEAGAYYFVRTRDGRRGWLESASVNLETSPQ